MQPAANSVTSQAAQGGGERTRSIRFETRVTSSLQKNKGELWLILPLSLLESISSSCKHKEERVKKGRNQGRMQKASLLPFPSLWDALLFSKFNFWLRSDRRSFILMMLFSKLAGYQGNTECLPFYFFNATFPVPYSVFPEEINQDLKCVEDIFCSLKLQLTAVCLCAPHFHSRLSIRTSAFNVVC